MDSEKKTERIDRKVVHVFADLWNFVHDSEMFDDDPASIRSWDTRVPIKKFPFDVLSQKILQVTGPSDYSKFNVFCRAPSQKYDLLGNKERSRKTRDIEKEIRAKVGMFTKVHSHIGKDIDSMLVSKMWKKCICQIRRCAEDGIALPYKMDLVLISGDAIFIKALRDIKRGCEGFLDIRCFVFGWRASLSNAYLDAEARGTIESWYALDNIKPLVEV